MKTPAWRSAVILGPWLALIGGLVTTQSVHTVFYLLGATLFFLLPGLAIAYMIFVGWNALVGGAKPLPKDKQ